MSLHDFILPKPHTNSTVFDFLVIFCSFYVYSLVPGVWHPVWIGVNALSGFQLKILFKIREPPFGSSPPWFNVPISLEADIFCTFVICHILPNIVVPGVWHPVIIISTWMQNHRWRWYKVKCVNALSGLYLISTWMTSLISSLMIRSVNALSGLYLISTVPLQKPRFYAVSRACFCRYLSEYSGNSRFSCMLTFWTYLMRFTYHWHWIKYSTKYNRCHLIFSLSW